MKFIGILPLVLLFVYEDQFSSSLNTKRPLEKTDFSRKDITNAEDKDLQKLVNTTTKKREKRSAECDLDTSPKCSEWNEKNFCNDSEWEVYMNTNCDTTCNCPVKVLTATEYDAEVEASVDIEVLTRATLGRPASLGALYDIHSDQFIPGFSLWSPKQIEELKETVWHPSSSVTMGVASSNKEKHRFLGVEADLRFSYNSGSLKVVVYGAAKYLDHSEDVDDIAQVAVHYQSISKTETLSSKLVENVNSTSPGCKWVKAAADSGTSPTHVVSSVTFGGNAHFVFEQDIKDKEDKMEIYGRLEVEVEYLLVKIKGSAQLNYTTVENNHSKDMKMTLYSDFILPIQPSTVDETIAVYEQISTYFGNRENKFKYSVPMTMVLIPIEKFCPEDKTVSVEITEKVMEEAGDIRLQLLAVISKIEKLLTNFAALSFAVEEVLSDFYSKVKTYELEYTVKLGEAIIGERSGHSENTVHNLINGHALTNFVYTKFLLPYLTERKREVNVINIFYIETVSQDEPQISVYDEASIPLAIVIEEKVFILTLYVLPDFEQESFERFVGLNNNPIEVSSWKAKQWFNNYPLIGDVGSRLRSFREFFAANSYKAGSQYFVMLKEFNYTSNMETTASSMAKLQLFQNGEEIDGFQIPPVADISSNGLYPLPCRYNEEVNITLQNPLNNQVEGPSQIISFYVTYYVNDALFDSSKSLNIPIDFTSTETKFTIRDLVREQNYNITIAYNTEYGLGLAATFEVIGTLDVMTETDGCFIQKSTWYTNATVLEAAVKTAKECAKAVASLTDSASALWIYELATFSCLMINPTALNSDSSNTMKIVSAGWASGTRTCAKADDVMHVAACPVHIPQPSQKSEIVLLIGGNDPSGSSVEQFLAPSTTLPDLDDSVKNHISFVTPDNLYLMCKSDGECSQLKTSTMTWTYHSGMTTSRSSASVAVLPAGTFVIGGYPVLQDLTSRTSMDFLATGFKEWTKITITVPGHTMVIEWTCAVAVDEDNIIVIGGKYRDDQVLNYNHPSETWTKLDSIPTAYGIYKHQCIKYNDSILIVGGYARKLNPTTTGRTMIYNVQTGILTFARLLNIYRLGHQVVELNNEIYAIGGVSAIGFPIQGANFIERFDQLNEEWEIISSDHITTRIYSSTLKIPCPNYDGITCETITSNTAAKRNEVGKKGLKKPNL